VAVTAINTKILKLCKIILSFRILENHSMKSYLEILKKLLLFLILIIFLVSCSLGEPSDENLETLFCPPASVKESLNLVFEMARKWNDKAYLESIDIPINTDCEARPWILGASFQSPDNNKQSIIIYIEKDNHLSLHHVQHPNGVYQVEPITNSDWKLDSGEALEEFLEQHGQEIRGMSTLDRADLYLMRKAYDSKSIVVWRFFVTEGSSIDSITYNFYIDALTAEGQE
jgi:hypothetical protein